MDSGSNLPTYHDHHRHNPQSHTNSNILDLSYSSLNEIQLDNLDFIDSALSIETFFNTLADCSNINPLESCSVPNVDLPNNTPPAISDDHCEHTDWCNAEDRANESEQSVSHSSTEKQCSKVSKKAALTDSNKPPEPYADMIAKAILSSPNNMIQLKDIYDFISTNYEYFSTQLTSVRWRNAVRHNLSSHKYFVKTLEKNAKGHFWSIHPAYINLLRNSLYEGKLLKTLKIGSKFKRSSNKNKTETVNGGTRAKTAHAKSTPVRVDGGRQKRKAPSKSESSESQSSLNHSWAQGGSNQVEDSSAASDDNMASDVANRNATKQVLCNSPCQPRSPFSTVSAWSASESYNDSAYLSSTDFENTSYASYSHTIQPSVLTYSYNQPMTYHSGHSASQSSSPEYLFANNCYQQEAPQQHFFSY